MTNPALRARLLALLGVVVLSASCSSEVAPPETANAGDATAPAVAIDPAIPEAAPADVATPEAIVAAAYNTLRRRPGESIDWNRFASLYLPRALLVPNVEQNGGEFRTLGVAEFQAWAEALFAATGPIGSPNDHGLMEDQIGSVIHRYGDIAQVMSSYVRRGWESDVIDGRGVNAFTLVNKDDRWWILSVAWDEEVGAGPIPDSYLGSD